MEQQTTKSITTAIEEFLWHCRFEKNLDDKTIKAYNVDLAQFSCMVGETYALKEITKSEIKRYLQSISHFQHKTIKRKLASLRAMLNYFECEDESYINPMRKMQIRMREPMRLPTVMNLDELRKILRAVHLNATEPATHYSTIAAIRNIAVIELLFATGMRVSELCNLKNKDVDIIHGIIRIIGKGDKERVIYVCQEDTISALTQWIGKKNNNDEERPFFTNRLHRPLSSQSVRHLVRRLVQDAGLNKHITPHTFRHTLATLLLEEDVDIRYIQSILGHSSISTTQIYTHVNLSKQKQIFQVKHPRRLI